MAEKAEKWTAALMCRFCGNRWRKPVQRSMVPAFPDPRRDKYSRRTVKDGLYFMAKDVVTPTFTSPVLCPNCGNSAGIVIETPSEALPLDEEEQPEPKLEIIEGGK